MAAPHSPRLSTRRLPVELAWYRTTRGRHRLPHRLKQFHLVMVGIGVMIGGGIFSLAGQQAATTAGPAVIVSFMIAGLVSLLAGLCYAELSSTVPVAGSVYTYAYVAFGEVWAWLVGWALLLELVLAGSVVSRITSQYVVSTIEADGIGLPDAITSHSSMSGLNLLAPIIVLALSVLIAGGSRLTGSVINVWAIAKTALILLLIVVGLTMIKTANYRPFVPPAQPAEREATPLLLLTGWGETSFGSMGVILAAGVIVFAFIGFDLITTAAEDAVEPRRSLPRAILWSLIIVWLTYLAMAVVLVGLGRFDTLGTDAPFVDAMRAAGGGSWVALIAGVAAVLGCLTVVAVVLVGLSRVLFSMGRDGLLPSPLGTVNQYWGSPATAALVAGSVCAVLSAVPGTLAFANLLVLGALFAWFFCAMGVLVLRRLRPDLERGFRIPGGPLVPLLAAAAIVWLALTIGLRDWAYFGVWMIVGAVAYLLYGTRHSRLVVGEEPTTTGSIPIMTDELAAAIRRSFDGPADPLLPQAKSPRGGRRRA